MSIKPSDCYTIPLCATHHRQQHDIGELSFKLLYGVNLEKIEADLWQRSEHGIKWRRKLEKVNGH